MSTSGSCRFTIPLKPKGHAVGIDLGHHQLAGRRGASRASRAACPADEGDALLLPSVVHYGTDGGVVVGAAGAGRWPRSTPPTPSSR